MPAFIKTPKDEKRWSRAKEAADKTLSESSGDKYWALVNSIYQKMTKSESVDSLKEILIKAKSRIRDEYDPEEEAYGDSEDSGDLDGLNIQDSPDGDSEDEADKWLREHDAKNRSKANESDDGKNEENVESNDGEDDASSSKATEAGQKSSKTKKEEVAISPERLAALKDVVPHWLNQADQVKKLRAEARQNPKLFAEGHRIAAHNAAHEDYNDAYHKFVNSDEYKGLSEAKKMRAEVQFKKDWLAKNPDLHTQAAQGVGHAHEMHDKAQALHQKEKQARIAHIKTGTHGADPDQVMSAQEAAQHVGGAKDAEEGGYTSSIISDPAAVFASGNQEYLKNIAKPNVSATDEDETLEAAEAKIAKHPKLQDPANKKLLDDFVKDHHDLISRTAHRARKQAQARGIPEDKIDMSALHEAGLHGLMQAVNDYHPETGSSFGSHAAAKMSGLMQSHLGSLDYIPKELRSGAKAHASGKLKLPPVQEPEIAQASAPASTQSSEPAAQPKPAANDIISGSSHPAAKDMADRLARVNTQRVLVRKKGQ